MTRARGVGPIVAGSLIASVVVAIALVAFPFAGAAENVISGVVLVGHSFGGLYALNFAARYPEQVAGVVLLDATHPEMFARLRTYPMFYEGFRRVSARQARSLRTLGARTLIVVTAGRGTQDGWMPLQNDLAALSTNSVHRVPPNAAHESLTQDRGDAAQSSQAIHDVVEAVRLAAHTSPRSAPPPVLGARAP